MARAGDGLSVAKPRKPKKSAPTETGALVPLAPAEPPIETVEGEIVDDDAPLPADALMPDNVNIPAATKAAASVRFKSPDMVMRRPHPDS